MPSGGKDTRRMWISMELDENREPIGTSIDLNTSLSTLTPYLKDSDRKYLTKKMRSEERPYTIYKGMCYMKKLY